MFSLYELAGVATNLVAGFMGDKWGLRRTLLCGLTIQLGGIGAAARGRLPFSPSFLPRSGLSGRRAPPSKRPPPAVSPPNIASRRDAVPVRPRLGGEPHQGGGGRVRDHGADALRRRQGPDEARREDGDEARDAGRQAEPPVQARGVHHGCALWGRTPSRAAATPSAPAGAAHPHCLRPRPHGGQG